MLTEAEITALDDDAPTTSSNAPTTTAPAGAPIEQVNAGMKEVEAVKQQQRGRGQHGEDGPSAHELRKQEREEAMISHAVRSRGTDQR